MQSGISGKSEHYMSPFWGVNLESGNTIQMSCFGDYSFLEEYGLTL